MFLDDSGNRTTKTTVKFVDGVAKIKLVLNENITAKNNPRTGWLEGLNIRCKIYIQN